ncbi:MAG: universal stress protein [Cyclobacteriaceae bacterium]|jgi:nucleotide-binding universal stress UspA family protein|nr:universal stress protein [Cyclobacteriaceae bacterium]
MKILVPTDFSDCARHALDFAGNLAFQTKSQLSLLHVVMPLHVTDPGLADLVEAEMIHRKQQFDDDLKDWSAIVYDKYLVPAETQVRFGDLARQIALLTEQEKTNLIVMGTEGASGLKKMLYGSRTSQVIEYAKAPVLAVPVNASLQLPKRIVFATNFFDSDLKSLHQLIDLVKGWMPDIYLLHISQDHVRQERDYIEAFSEQVKKETQYTKLFYYVLPHDDNEKGINLFVKSMNCDMIALATRKRNFMEKLISTSLTKEIVQQAALPVLAFHVDSASNVKLKTDYEHSHPH